MYKMLRALCTIQSLAYQTADKRCPRDILRMYVATYRFSMRFSEIFKSPKNLSVRKMFGTPYHSLVKHFPELYRLVSLRSVVAEAAERLFTDFRFVELASKLLCNMHVTLGFWFSQQFWVSYA